MAERYLPYVIDAILKEVPAGNDSLTNQLKSLQESAKYTPPEAMRDRWVQLSGILNDNLGWPPSAPWHHTINAIVADVKFPAVSYTI